MTDAGYQEPQTSSGSFSLIKLIKSNPQRAFIIMFLLVLSCISFYTTYDGLIRFSYGGFEQTPTAFIIVLFLFVAVLQGMLLFSLFEVLNSRFLLKFIWLFVYIATMAVSVFFSYSFYYNLFRADSYAFDNFSVQLNRVKNSALNYQDAFQGIKKDTEKLADYSRRRAEEERQRGGTCGYMSPPKSGPRSRYRDKEAKIFTALSADISDLYDEVSTDIRKLEEQVKSYTEKDAQTDEIQNQMNKVVQKLNSYKNNGKVLNLSTTIRNHMYEKRKTDGNDTLGFPITCPDENIDIKGTAIIKQVGVLPQVSDVKLFNPDSDKEVLTRALTVFMQIPRALFPDSFLTKMFGKDNAEEVAATKITSLDYSPLVLGGLIDLFIFIVGLADGMGKRKQKWSFKHFTGRYVSTDDIPSMSQVANEFMFMGDLRRHIHRKRQGIFLVIPASMNALNDQQRGIVDLAEAMESTGMLAKPVVVNTTWANLPRDAQAALYEVYQDADERYYTIYRVPPRLWKELQQAYYSWHINNEVVEYE
jgi:archaellum component FlaC